MPFSIAYFIGNLAEKISMPLVPFGIRPIGTRHSASLFGRDNDIDNSLAKAALGWKTEDSYEETMIEIKEWVQQTGI